MTNESTASTPSTPKDLPAAIQAVMAATNVSPDMLERVRTTLKANKELVHLLSPEDIHKLYSSLVSFSDKAETKRIVAKKRIDASKLDLTNITADLFRV